MTGLAFALLGFVMLAPAQTPAPVLKVAVFNVQSVIAQIQDGQRAASHMRVMFAPRQTELERKQHDIAALREKGRKGANTEQEREMNALLGKIQTVVKRYASKNGCALVIDISQRPTLVFYASNTIEITGEIVALYDKAALTTSGIKRELIR